VKTFPKAPLNYYYQAASSAGDFTYYHTCLLMCLMCQTYAVVSLVRDFVKLSSVMVTLMVIKNEKLNLAKFL